VGGSQRNGADPASLYRGLRSQVLGLAPGEAGLFSTPGLPRVWGALLESGLSRGTATLVSLADGTTSLYTSSGFGIIGGGAHPPVAAATRQFLLSVEARYDEFEPDLGASIPGEGQIKLWALGYEGRRSRQSPAGEVGPGPHPLLRVIRAGNAVITQLRLIDERRTLGTDHP